MEDSITSHGSPVLPVRSRMGCHHCVQGSFVLLLGFNPLMVPFCFPNSSIYSSQLFLLTYVSFIHNGRNEDHHNSHFFCWQLRELQDIFFVDSGRMWPDRFMELLLPSQIILTSNSDGCHNISSCLEQNWSNWNLYAGLGNSATLHFSLVLCCQVQQIVSISLWYEYLVLQ